MRDGHGAATVEEAGARGGRARADALPSEERSRIASEAARARWATGLPRAVYGSVESPLKIGDTRIPCYVLDDDRRVITQQGAIEALGMSRGGGSGGRSGTRLAQFVSGESVKPYFKEGFDYGMSPIKFQTPAGSVAYGYPAIVLADICEAVLAARGAGGLHHNQKHIAAQAELLIRGFARVGIVALVDEATGYQSARARDALAEILKAFIAKELRGWVKTFPPDFYKELFRLRGIEYRDGEVKKPGYVGHLTNDLVYARLAPGVLDELRVKNPVVHDPATAKRGRRKVKHHQWLTDSFGHPKLLQHLDSIVSLMKAADGWEQFVKMIDRAKPRQIEMPLFDNLRE